MYFNTCGVIFRKINNRYIEEKKIENFLLTTIEPTILYFLLLCNF